jgi:hypothetical protein
MNNMFDFVLMHALIQIKMKDFEETWIYSIIHS